MTEEKIYTETEALQMVEKAKKTELSEGLKQINTTLEQTRIKAMTLEHLSKTFKKLSERLTVVVEFLEKAIKTPKGIVV